MAACIVLNVCVYGHPHFSQEEAFVTLSRCRVEKRQSEQIFVAKREITEGQSPPDTDW